MIVSKIDQNVQPDIRPNNTYIRKKLSDITSRKKHHIFQYFEKYYYYSIRHSGRKPYFLIPKSMLGFPKRRIKKIK